MKKLATFTVVMSLTVGSAFAAHPADSGEIVGNSNNADYPLLVRGTDGSDYFCVEDIVVKSGQDIRRCISNNGGLFAGGGLGGGAIFLIVVGGAAAAAAFSGGGNSTNGTN